MSISASESRHLARVKALSCAVCELRGERQFSPTEAHHIKRDPFTGRFLGASQKGNAYTTIPLCSHRHHWNGVHVGMGSREFERRYGNELDLLQRTYERLGLPYPYQIQEAS